MPAAKVSHFNHEASARDRGTSIQEREEKKSDYEAVLYNLHHDPRWIKEVNTGRRVGFYRFRGDLGQGNFSTVKLAHHQLSKDKVAVKVIEKSKLDQKTQRMLSREIAIMDVIAHPNIIRMFEVVETLSRIHLVLEFAPGGELFNRVTTEGSISEDEASGLFRQVISGVSYLHEICIVHRDIKAENVFLAGKKRVKLGDFGFSTRVTELEEQLSTFCGSPPYAAPELYKDESYYGPAVDVWALGVLLFFLLTADMPFKAATVAGLKRQILAGSFLIPSHVSEKARDIINKLMVQEPKERMTLANITSHPWLEETSSLHREALPKHVIFPRINATQEELTDPEVETFRALEGWGVSREALLNHGSTTGARSPLVATYRIYIHRLLHTKEEEETLENPASKKQDAHFSSGKISPDSYSIFEGRPGSPKKYRLRLKNGLINSRRLKLKACHIL